MTNDFIEFSRNAFVDFCKNLANFICYKNDATRIIFANRHGNVYKWSNHDGVVEMKELDYGLPSEILSDPDAVEWLKGVCRSKRWKGGLKKIDMYLSESDELLDERGIDPYFYAWMASKHYHPGSETSDDMNPFGIDSIDYQCLVETVSKLGETAIDNLSEIVNEFKKGNTPITDYIIVISDRYSSKTALDNEVSDFVDAHAKVDNFTPSEIIALKRDIVDMLTDYGAK